ncbi:PP2C family serine/threonine-protein phosphatase [Spongorhabdus nitratireducens]
MYYKFQKSISLFLFSILLLITAGAVWSHEGPPIRLEFNVDSGVGDSKYSNRIYCPALVDLLMQAGTSRVIFRPSAPDLRGAADYFQPDLSLNEKQLVIRICHEIWHCFCREKKFDPENDNFALVVQCDENGQIKVKRQGSLIELQSPSGSDCSSSMFPRFVVDEAKKKIWEPTIVKGCLPFTRDLLYILLQVAKAGSPGDSGRQLPETPDSCKPTTLFEIVSAGDSVFLNVQNMDTMSRFERQAFSLCPVLMKLPYKDFIDPVICYDTGEQVKNQSEFLCDACYWLSKSKNSWRDNPRYDPLLYRMVFVDHPNGMGGGQHLAVMDVNVGRYNSNLTFYPSESDPGLDMCCLNEPALSIEGLIHQLCQKLRAFKNRQKLQYVDDAKLVVKCDPHDRVTVYLGQYLLAQSEEFTGCVFPKRIHERRRLRQDEQILTNGYLPLTPEFICCLTQLIDNPCNADALLWPEFRNMVSSRQVIQMRLVFPDKNISFDIPRVSFGCGRYTGSLSFRCHDQYSSLWDSDDCSLWEFDNGSNFWRFGNMTSSSALNQLVSILPALSQDHWFFIECQRDPTGINRPAWEILNKRKQLEVGVSGNSFPFSVWECDVDGVKKISIYDGQRNTPFRPVETYARSSRRDISIMQECGHREYQNLLTNHRDFLLCAVEADIIKKLEQAGRFASEHMASQKRKYRSREAPPYRRALAENKMECIPLGEHKSACVVTNQGHRSDMEDSHYVALVSDTLRPFGIAGVYDGHGGSEASHYVATEVESSLKKWLERLNGSELQPEERVKWKGTGLSELVRTWNALKLFSVDLDREYTGNDGTTQLTCVLLDNWLWVSIAGDSRGLLVYPTGECIQLTEDQTAEAAQNNKANALKSAAEKRGGTVHYKSISIQDKGVVNSSLSCMRSIGDHMHLGVLNPRGKLTRYAIGEKEQEAWLILCCDGVFESDYMISKDVADIVKTVIDAGEGCNDTYLGQQIASGVVDEAYRRGSGDNITVIAVRVSALMTQQ